MDLLSIFNGTLSFATITLASKGYWLASHREICYCLESFPVSAADLRAACPEVESLSEQAFKLHAITDTFRDSNGENIVSLLIYLSRGLPFISYQVSHYFDGLNSHEACLKLLELNSKLLCAHALATDRGSSPVYLVSSSLRPELYKRPISSETIREAINDTLNSADTVASFFAI